ncbi:hypothetical protein GCM10019060_26290 [Novosphingobium pokkalii]|nr:hypothetical protein GCM10019060_26290 [Novosphingobium pokkalii]
MVEQIVFGLLQRDIAFEFGLERVHHRLMAREWAAEHDHEARRSAPRLSGCGTNTQAPRWFPALIQAAICNHPALRSVGTERKPKLEEPDHVRYPVCATTDPAAPGARHA